MRYRYIKREWNKVCYQRLRQKLTQSKIGHAKVSPGRGHKASKVIERGPLMKLNLLGKAK